MECPANAILNYKPLTGCYWDTELDLMCAFDSPVLVNDPDLCLPLACVGNSDGSTVACNSPACVPHYKGCPVPKFNVYFAGSHEGDTVVLIAPQYAYCEGKVYGELTVPPEGSMPECPAFGTCSADAVVCAGVGTERPDLTFADRTDQEQAKPLVD